MKHSKSFYFVCIFFLCLAASASGATRIVYNDAEPREGFPYPSGTKVLVTNDSLISVWCYRDVGNHWYEWNYANGANVAFSKKDSVVLGATTCGFTVQGIEDTLYTFDNNTSVAVTVVTKVYGGAIVSTDTVGSDTGSYRFHAVATDGSNWIAVKKTNRYQAAAPACYSYIVWRISGAEIGGATAWTLVDTIGGNSATTQYRAMAAPVMGGLLMYNQNENTWDLIENRASGGITKRISTVIRKKNASTAINAGASFYDMSITPIDPNGAGDTVLVATCDSTNNKVWIYMVVADTSANTVAKIDSAEVSTAGDVSDILDSAAWRTPTITMAGTGFIVYYRDWADTTDLATARIAYHVATDWTDLTTIGAAQYLATDSAGAGGTIGAIMAPWTAVAHADTDSVYAYVAWARWDATMNIYATYQAIGIPGGSGGTPPTTARLILGAMATRKVNLGKP